MVLFSLLFLFEISPKGVKRIRPDQTRLWIIFDLSEINWKKIILQKILSIQKHLNSENMDTYYQYYALSLDNGYIHSRESRSTHLTPREVSATILAPRNSLVAMGIYGLDLWLSAENDLGIPRLLCWKCEIVGKKSFELIC